MKYKMKLVIICILLVGICWCMVSIGVSHKWIDVNTYTYTTEAVAREQKIRLIVLSDLHDCEFGAGNEKLVSKVANHSPDVILLDGDLLNAESVNAEIPCTLIRKLAEIAPVYYALGNQEIEYMEFNGRSLLDELEEAGAFVLDKEYVDINIEETLIRLGGMYDYAFGADGKDSAEAAPEDVKEFLEDFQDTDNLKIMMAHRPDSFIFGNVASYWNVDLVISGHNHGGQVVIPFFGGLYGGDQGWFPEYVHGMYEKYGMSIFVTSGLGSDGEVLPRFNNRPEVAVMEIFND